jgi:hypothetical protein
MNHNELFEMLAMLEGLMEFGAVTDALKQAYQTIPPTEALDRALERIDDDLPRLEGRLRFLLTDVRSLVVIARAYNEAYDRARTHRAQVEKIEKELAGEGADEQEDGGIDLSGFDEWFSGMRGDKDDTAH